MPYPDSSSENSLFDVSCDGIGHDLIGKTLVKHLATWIEKDKDAHFNENFPAAEFRLWNARLEDVPWDDVSGLVLTGGNDISLGYLKQEVPDPALIIEPNETRDAWDFAALKKALEIDLPILAICRGHQVLNVALGGTLLLDIPGHKDLKYDNVQTLRHASGVEIKIPRVNSSHHQAIDKLGDGLEIEAWYTEDDVIEQVRLKNHPFVFGAQYHPERDLLYRPIFDAFISHLR